MTPKRKTLLTHSKSDLGIASNLLLALLGLKSMKHCVEHKAMQQKGYFNARVGRSTDVDDVTGVGIIFLE